MTVPYATPGMRAMSGPRHRAPTRSPTVALAQPHTTATRPDGALLLTILAMVLLGMVMVQSASQFADPTDPTAFARREWMWVGMGTVALVVTLRIDYHWWRRVSLPLIVVALALSALVLKLGVSVGGAQRWISLGSFFSFQPSEILKFAFVLFAAERLGNPRGAPLAPRFWQVVGVALGSLALVLLQNDLGTTIVLAACAFAICAIAGAPWLPLLAISGVGAVLGAAVIAATPFRRARILGFLHPMQCDAATSYHICQSLIALGSGGPLGRGLGDGLQKAGYLPAPFTDSIFAVIGEELGLWGGLLVIGMVALLLWRGLRASTRALDRQGAILAGGITCWLVTQAVLNIGSSVAALPFTGVPLPFISFGGSSLVVSLAAVGVLLNITTQQ
jgi:cell division protein FtsW